jgi:hypothetical protein
MTQSLWYLRHEGRVYGPFPIPLIDEYIKAGDVGPDWEVSLNETDWLTIAESGQFNTDESTWPKHPETDLPSWREERKLARQRWMGEAGAVDAAVTHDPEQDAAVRKAVVHDREKTEFLLNAEKNRRMSLLAPLLAVLLLLAGGVAVWRGEPEKPIRADIGLAADCGMPAKDGVNWSHCDKRGLNQPGMRARNAKLDGVRLDDARLAGSDLTYAVLRAASLRNVQLSGSALVGADLSGANLSGADLTGADLRYAVLKDANLTGARIDSVRLGKAVWTDGRMCEEGAPGSCR